MTNTEPPRQAALLDIEQTLRQAVEHHRAGRQEEAVALYQSILQADPCHAEANNNMGAMAVQVKQPAAGLPYFMAALEADPSRERYWLNYIDALAQADQLETARDVLALARQQGLQGDEVEALAARLEEGKQVAEEPKAKPATPDKPTGKSAPQKGGSPGPREIDSLVDLFGQGRFAEAAALAQAMTVRFPQHEFGWKALGAACKQMGRTADALVPMQRAAALSPRDVEAHFNLGVTLQELGRRGEAETSYRRALEINPDYVDAHGNLGVILQDQCRLNEAETSFRRALEIKPDNPRTLSNLGVVLQGLGRLDEAETNFRRALQINPDNPEAHNNLGNTLKRLRRPGDAEASYRRALEISPNYADAHSNLGIVLQELGRPGEAEASYRRALEIKPDMAEALGNLGITLKELGRLDEAEAMLRRALQINPDYANAHGCLGVILHDLDRPIEAEASCRRALEINPDIAGLHCNLGGVLHNLDRLEEAEASYRRALQIEPDLAEAHFGLGNPLKSLGRLDEARASYAKAHQLGFCGAQTKEAFALPAIMGTRQELLKSRAEFERNLDKLIADGLTIDDPLKSVGEANFFLAYHGLNDRDLQVKVAKYYEQVCPSLLHVAPHCTEPKSDAAKKIRVGFLSKFLYKHPVSLCFSKIIETLSLKEQFQVSLISSQPIDEKLYSEFVGQRVQLSYNLVRAREMIAALELDVLVYLDIGMEPLSYFLAFSRLARTQCVLGGHPVTTGIATMDYFLSADRMEPRDADEHYSEKLFRLPRPLAQFGRPALPARLKSRHELNLPTGSHIYMCPMSMQKLHPDFDEAIARILQLDGNGVVVLFEDWRRCWWKTALLKRFESTIPAGLRQRIVFLPWLKDPADFISALAAADVVLDPFHFGIGSTVAMTSITGTPLVTRRGEFMRGRVGAYYCETFDLAECIAEDTEGYARKAVEIASNPHLRERIKAKILTNSQILYEDQEPADDLVDFLCSLTASWRNPSNGPGQAIADPPPPASH
ncbi:MAG: tetratricopeptide repeat protein [Sulfuritalea sp.]|nr:tetratricopeptide repeat protein [Sulfuritalea sp.]